MLLSLQKLLQLILCKQPGSKSHIETKRNNFDLIRLVLATTVFFVHISHLTRLPSFAFFDNFLNSGVAIDAFFVVSGFLIFMSYEKSSSLKSYFLKRINRIFPGYFCVILACAFLLFFIANRSLSQYFSLAWFQYIIANLSTLNFIQHSLPGVFTDNAIPAVNGALWTIKIEVMFYFMVPLIALLLPKTKKFVLILGLYFFAVCYSTFMNTMAKHLDSNIFYILERQLPGQLAFFMSGALLFYYYPHFNRYAFVYLLLAIVGYIISQIFGLYIIYPMSLAVIVVGIASIGKYLGNWGKFGDFSYGIYIWHFPVIQIFIHFELFDKMPYLTLILLIITVLTLAYLSWHLIEKPFLSRKSHYRAVERNPSDKI